MKDNDIKKLCVTAVAVILMLAVIVIIVLTSDREAIEPADEDVKLSEAPDIVSDISSYRNRLLKSLPDFDIAAESLYNLNITSDIIEVSSTFDINASKGRITAVTLESTFAAMPEKPDDMSGADGLYYELVSAEHSECMNAFKNIFTASLKALDTELKYSEELQINAAFDSVFESYSGKSYTKNLHYDSCEIIFLITPVDNYKMNVCTTIIPLTDSSK